jgi:hypothetical protein
MKISPGWSQDEEIRYRRALVEYIRARRLTLAEAKARMKERRRAEEASRLEWRAAWAVLAISAALWAAGASLAAWFLS